MRNVSDKCCKESENAHFVFNNVHFIFNNAHFIFNNAHFIFNNSPPPAVCVILRKNVQPGSFACWMSRAEIQTHSHSTRWFKYDRDKV
jgi:hypothetical protein